MEENALINSLSEFGLTKQEATIYLELFKKGMQTGYEVSKQTGISRSNAYSALAGLVETGAAYICEENATKYVAVDINEFCKNKLRSLEQKKTFLIANMPKGEAQQDGYFTITTDEQIIHKVKNMLQTAQKRVYLSMTVENLNYFFEEITELEKRQIKIVILTSEPVTIIGATAYVIEDKGTQIGVITDSCYVMTGELGKGTDSNCLYSGQSNLVRVFKDLLKNEIKLIELEGERRND